MTKNRFLVKHETFSENAFNDCIRYCKAKIIEKFIDGAVIEIHHSVYVLSAERPNGYRTFVFKLKLQVISYIGPHLGVGLDYITATVEGIGDVKIKKFEHIKSYELPCVLLEIQLIDEISTISPLLIAFSGLKDLLFKTSALILLLSNKLGKIDDSTFVSCIGV